LEKAVRSACQACHCECGVLVYVKDGKVVKVEGDPDHPMSRGFICIKGSTYPELLYHPNRLKYPLKRIGRRRGEGKWQRISWDEALSIIASKLKEIKEKYGAQAICTSQGTGPKGNILSTVWLAYAIGSPNVTSIGHICWFPTMIAEYATLGGMVTAEAGPDYKRAKCIVIWGANPPQSHPAKGRDILLASARGAKLIVVDPRLTDLASRADIWLQVRPGTDAALALGMLNVIINEGLCNEDFVGKWCVGFERLSNHVRKYSPKKVSEITWVPAEEITKAARMYATTKPATLHRRVAIEHNTNATQTARAIVILSAVTGNIDIKGGNLFPIYPSKYVSGMKLRLTVPRPPRKVEEKRIGAKEFPLLSGPDAIFPIAHKPTLLKTIITGKPYPIKALFATNNLVINSENSKEAWAALKKLDFLVVADFFMTPTAELADIVLPVATWLEKDEICDYPSYTNYVSVRQKAIEPVYECWDDLKITLEIIKRMGVEGYLQWKNVEEYNDYRLRPMGITFEDLKKKAYIIEPMKYRKYESGLLRPNDKQGFNTPSGKIELYSSLFEKFGYDPLPSYVEPQISPVSTPKLAKEYPQILITGGKHIAYFHSEGRQISSLRKLVPDPLIEIHPETAEKLGIGEGDWVWIETPRGKGRIRQKAKLTRGIYPKVVHAQHHWWFPEEPGPEHGCWKSNINVIMPSDPPYDRICGATPLRGYLCKIYKDQEL